MKFTEVITFKFVFTLADISQFFDMYERHRIPFPKISVYSEKGFTKKKKNLSDGKKKVFQ